MNLGNVGTLLSAILAVLTAVSATTNAVPESVVAIVQKLASALAALQGLKDPTSVSAAVADLTAILAEVKSAFPQAATAADQAEKQALQFEQVVHDYTSGQVALLDSNFSAFGVPGDVFAIAKGSTSDAAVAFRKSVGLE